MGLLLGLSPVVEARQWVYDVKVTKLGTYHGAPGHFVWLSQQPTECTGTVFFSEDVAGGKSLMAVLTAAVLSKATVDVQVDACSIVEVYLK
jgi:hypothetical protein